MLRTKKCAQVHMFMEDIDGGTQLAIDPGGIGNQTDPLPLKQVKVPFGQYLHPGFYLCNSTLEGKKKKKTGKAEWLDTGAFSWS